MADETPTDSPRTGSLLVIFLTVFIDLLGFGIVLPLLPIYGKEFAATHGLSEAAVGWTIGALMSSYSLMQFCFLPVWGRLSDRYGRRPILMLGLAGSVLFYALFGLATAWQSLTGLFISRIGAGIAGATISTAQAYIADTTSLANRARGMALIGAAFALGFTLGPILGAVALLSADVAQSPWPGLLASGLSAIALLLCIFVLPESHQHAARHAARHRLDASSLRLAWTIPSVGLLLLTAFIAVFSFANFESTLSLQIDKIATAGSEQPWVRQLTQWIRSRGLESTDQVKLVLVLMAFALLGITLTISQGFLVRRLASRMSETRMAVMGAIIALGAFVVLAIAARNDQLDLLLLGMLVEVVGFSFVNPSLQSLISRRSPPQHQGAILGLSQSALSLARILGPVFGVRLFAAAASWPYWAASGLMGLALVLIVQAGARGRDYVAGKD